MKLKTIAIIFLAMLATACAKNDFYTDLEGLTKTRTIIATFNNTDTKTTIDENRTPLWSEGDKIWVSDGTNTKTITLVLYGTTPETDQAVISEDRKSFSFTLPIQGWGSTIYSVYPASCATGTAGVSGIGITIPTVQGGNFEHANICVAQGTSTLSYKNATAIIKVTQTTAGANDYMFLTASTSAIAGIFTASIDGNNVSLTTGGTTYSKIGGKVQSSVSFYAIAPCSSSTLTFKARETVGNRLFADKQYNNGYTFAVNTIYKLEMSSFSSENYDELIPIGLFSVSDTKTVEFSPGNLFKDGTASAWKFEQNQYDYGVIPQGTEPETYKWTPNHISHLYWTKNADNSHVEEYSDDGRATTDDLFCGEGKKLCINGLNAIWYTLSNNEWNYLLTGRSNASNLYKCGVTVCGKTDCMVIAPDDYTAGIASSYNSTTWSTAESEGLICLPATGYRSSSNVINTDCGYYWSSAPDEYDLNNAYRLYFWSEGAYTEAQSRSEGGSVRLVRNITE